MPAHAYPTLLGDHVLLEMPKSFFTEYHDRLRTATVLAVSSVPANSPPNVGDQVAFPQGCARVLDWQGQNFLVVRRAELCAVVEPASK